MILSADFLAIWNTMTILPIIPAERSEREVRNRIS